MKNKSKKKKIAQKNAYNNSKAAVIKEWLYLSKEEKSFRNMTNIFENSETVSAQLWEEAGVMELEIAEHKSIDFEIAAGDFDEVDYFREHAVKTVYFVTIAPDEFEVAKAVMKEIVDAIGGVFCEDNDSFSSMIGTLED